MTGPGSRARRIAATPGVGVALVVVASALAVVLVPLWLLRNWDATAQSRAFVATPQFALWVLVLCGQAATSVSAAVFVVATVRTRARDLRNRGSLPGATIAAIVAAALGITLAAGILLFGSRLGILADVTDVDQVPSGDEWPLQGHEAKVRPFVAIVFVIGLVAIAGMWLTAVGFEALARDGKPRAASVTRFLHLRGELTALLAVTALLVGLATLASGTLREAAVATNDQPVYRQQAVRCLAAKARATPAVVRAKLDAVRSQYPECTPVRFDERYVLSYGLLFSGLLAIAFTPSYFAMRRAGARLTDQSFPLARPTSGRFFEIVDDRAAFDTLLQTSLSATATFKAAAAILTPLAASVVSTIVPS